jgi:TPR repeat protein
MPGTRDLPQAATSYGLSAAQEYPDGQFRFGFCLEHSIGVPKDLAMAAFYYRFSADQGHFDGQLHYTMCLENGVGASRR